MSASATDVSTSKSEGSRDESARSRGGCWGTFSDFVTERREYKSLVENPLKAFIMSTGGLSTVGSVGTYFYTLGQTLATRAGDVPRDMPMWSLGLLLGTLFTGMVIYYDNGIKRTNELYKLAGDLGLAIGRLEEIQRAATSTSAPLPENFASLLAGMKKLKGVPKSDLSPANFKWAMGVFGVLGFGLIFGGGIALASESYEAGLYLLFFGTVSVALALAANHKAIEAKIDCYQSLLHQYMSQLATLFKKDVTKKLLPLNLVSRSMPSTVKFIGQGYGSEYMQGLNNELIEWNVVISSAPTDKSKDADKGVIERLKTDKVYALKRLRDVSGLAVIIMMIYVGSQVSKGNGADLTVDLAYSIYALIITCVASHGCAELFITKEIEDESKDLERDIVLTKGSLTRSRAVAPSSSSVDAGDVDASSGSVGVEDVDEKAKWRTGVKIAYAFSFASLIASFAFLSTGEDPNYATFFLGVAAAVGTLTTVYDEKHESGDLVSRRKSFAGLFKRVNEPGQDYIRELKSKYAKKHVKDIVARTTDSVVSDDATTGDTVVATPVA